MAEGDWQIFQLHELLGNFSDKPVDYHEFLRVPTLNLRPVPLAGRCQGRTSSSR